MPYQTQLAEIARAAGLKVVEEPGWKTRGSPSFSPQFVIAHHTAIDGDAASIRVVRDGRPDLKGPLSQFVLTKDGTVHVIAAGRANHAGDGVWKGISGNANSYGIEAVNKGDGTPWPQVQLDAFYKLAAALAKNLGKSAAYVASHKEYATPAGRKIDPRGIDMNNFRQKVSSILAPIPPEEVPVAVVVARPQGGYVVLQTRDGGVFTYDGAPFYGSLPSLNVVSKAVGIAWTATGLGYWILAADGAIFSFGDAQYKGALNTITADGNRVPIGIVAKGEGYMLVTQDPSGDASPYDAYGF